MKLSHGFIKDENGKDVFVSCSPLEDGHVYTDENDIAHDCLSITQAEENTGVRAKWTPEMTEKFKKETTHGIFIHRMLEKSIDGDKLACDSDEVKHIWNFLQDRKKDGYEVLSEFTVNGNCHNKNFVGTIDAVLVRDNKVVICDWKTGNSNFSSSLKTSAKRPAVVQVNAYAKLLKDANPKIDIDKLLIVSTKKSSERGECAFDSRPYKEDIADHLFIAASENKSYDEINSERSLDSLSQNFKDTTEKLSKVMTRKNELEEGFKNTSEYKGLVADEKKYKDALKKEIMNKADLMTSFSYGDFNFSNSFKVEVDQNELEKVDPDLFNRLAKETQKITITQKKDSKGGDGTIPF